MKKTFLLRGVKQQILSFFGVGVFFAGGGCFHGYGFSQKKLHRCTILRWVLWRSQPLWSHPWVPKALLTARSYPELSIQHQWGPSHCWKQHKPTQPEAESRSQFLFRRWWGCTKLGLWTSDSLGCRSEFHSVHWGVVKVILLPYSQK